MAHEVVGRLETLETTMRTLVAEVAADRKAMLDMLGELQHELRAARGENSQPAIVLEKIEDVGKSIAGLSERFEAIRTLAPASSVETRLAALESRLADQPGAIANAIAYMLDERRAAEPEPLQLTATDGHGAEVGQKLAKLETMLRTQWERIEEGSKAHERDLNELFEGLVKLGSNQQTLADNLDAWRLDNAGDVSIVSNRLKNLEQMLHDVVSPPQPVGSRPRNLKRWLYGTASVLPSTWRSDVAALRDSLRSTRNPDKN
jgi:chromosome segregation ATPase